tara:strand:+ start:865 stop:2400 length:1536 start_codon:yes stop_codon:yes gene_type:complete
MKKFVIVGSGTSGLIAAGMIKKYWNDEVDVTLIHDKDQENISVGESTTPFVHAFLTFCEIPEQELIKEIDATIKLGINFKNWIPDTEYFHGFAQVDSGKQEDSSATYSILYDEYDGGSLYNKPSNKVPFHIFENFSHALHLDTRQFTDYLYEKLREKLNVVVDIVTRVQVEDNNIKYVETKSNGIFDADYFIDATGFNRILFKHLKPQWNDMSQYLPIDRAIPQQVEYDFGDELPSYTQAEATDNGWIWKIPIGNRFGTGYLYSSKFTSDKEAREKYNGWLNNNFNVNLTTNRVIKYEPGYYEDYWIGNCLAVGLSSGFVEPLESTGIHIIIKQLYDFIFFNSNLKNLEFNRKAANIINRDLYTDIINFVCLHYNTNRTDSEFWKYLSTNKLEWVKDVEQKCKEEFMDVTLFRNNPQRSLWALDSYIQVANGLNMLSKEGIKNHLDSKPSGNRLFFSGQSILERTQVTHINEKNEKEKHIFVLHKKTIDSVRSSTEPFVNTAIYSDCESCK